MLGIRNVEHIFLQTVHKTWITLLTFYSFEIYILIFSVLFVYMTLKMCGILYTFDKKENLVGASPIVHQNYQNCIHL